MNILVDYAVTLVVAVLVSSRAARTVLSTAVLFLIAGLLLGLGAFGPPPTGHAGLLEVTVELALFSVLFADGMRTGGAREVRAMAPLLARALALAMPAAIVGVALLARWLLDWPWLYAFLLGAVLSPTDPVFISAIFDQQAVPLKLRRLLNLESGFNDDIALPIVMLLLVPLGFGGPGFWAVVGGLLVGLGLGVAIPWLAIWLEARPYFGAAGASSSRSTVSPSACWCWLPAGRCGSVFLSAPSPPA